MSLKIKIPFHATSVKAIQNIHMGRDVRSDIPEEETDAIMSLKTNYAVIYEYTLNKFPDKYKDGDEIIFYEEITKGKRKEEKEITRISKKTTNYLGERARVQSDLPKTESAEPPKEPPKEEPPKPVEPPKEVVSETGAVEAKAEEALPPPNPTIPIPDAFSDEKKPIKITYDYLQDGVSQLDIWSKMWKFFWNGFLLKYMEFSFGRVIGGTLNSLNEGYITGEEESFKRTVIYKQALTLAKQALEKTKPHIDFMNKKFKDDWKAKAEYRISKRNQLAPVLLKQYEILKTKYYFVNAKGEIYPERSWQVRAPLTEPPKVFYEFPQYMVDNEGETKEVRSNENIIYVLETGGNYRGEKPRLLKEKPKPPKPRREYPFEMGQWFNEALGGQIVEANNEKEYEYFYHEGYRIGREHANEPLAITVGRQESAERWAQQMKEARAGKKVIWGV